MGCIFRPTLKDLEQSILNNELMMARFERQLVRIDLDSDAYTDVLRIMDGIQIELERDRARRAELLKNGNWYSVE
ncbi:MAG TPA: hypothetical protein DGS68_06015 [Pseudomonas sp.]|nr:hypothetical protein [Pseudomonas sp.]